MRNELKSAQITISMRLLHRASSFQGRETLVN